MTKQIKVGKPFYDKSSKKWLQKVKGTGKISQDCIKCVLNDHTCIDDCEYNYYLEVSKPTKAKSKTSDVSPTIQAHSMKIDGKERIINYQYIPDPNNQLPDIKWRKINEEPKGQYIVCLFDDNKLQPNEEQKIHETLSSAEKEAERLCLLYGKQFVVMKAVVNVKPGKIIKEQL